MKVFRVFVRASALGLTMTIFYLLWLPGKYLFSSFKEIQRRWREIVLCRGAHLAAGIIGMQIGVKGEPPQPPFFLVSNHLSYLDVIAFAARLNCVFVAKSEVSRWPLIGRLARSMGTIFIERNNHQDIPRVISLINKTLDEGLGVIIFAEGTSTMGEKVLPFNPALLEPAARGNYPVSYASIGYRTPPDETPAHTAVCWWGDMTFLPHLGKLLEIPRFHAFLTFGSHAIQSDDRKTLAKSLWKAVNDQFIPVVESSSVGQGKKV